MKVTLKDGTILEGSAEELSPYIHEGAVSREHEYHSPTPPPDRNAYLNVGKTPGCIMH